MTAAPKHDLISIDDYLAGELVSPVKHEYLGGYVYAIAGARTAHNMIAVNIVTSFRVRLRGNKCRPYNSDTKIRVRLPLQVQFCYPDASVVCEPNPQDDSYQDWPVVIVEVLSRRTRRIDEGEKKTPTLPYRRCKRTCSSSKNRPPWSHTGAPNKVLCLNCTADWKP